MKMIFLAFLLLVGSLMAQSTSSTHYNLNADISSGGGALVSSANYASRAIVGEVAGAASSSNYRTRIGFLAGSAQTNVSVSVSSVASQVKFRVGVPPSSCVAPDNQTALIGIYNVTVIDGAANIYASINETFPCFNVTLSNTSTCSAGRNLTTSSQTLISALTGQSYLWAYSNSLACLSIPPKFRITIGG